MSRSEDGSCGGCRNTPQAIPWQRPRHRPSAAHATGGARRAPASAAPPRAGGRPIPPRPSPEAPPASCHRPRKQRRLSSPPAELGPSSATAPGARNPPPYTRLRSAPSRSSATPRSGTAARRRGSGTGGRRRRWWSLRRADVARWAGHHSWRSLSRERPVSPGGRGTMPRYWRRALFRQGRCRRLWSNQW